MSEVDFKKLFKQINTAGVAISQTELTRYINKHGGDLDPELLSGLTRLRDEYNDLSTRKDGVRGYKRDEFEEVLKDVLHGHEVHGHHQDTGFEEHNIDRERRQYLGYAAAANFAPSGSSNDDGNNDLVLLSLASRQSSSQDRRNFNVAVNSSLYGGGSYMQRHVRGNINGALLSGFSNLDTGAGNVLEGVATDADRDTDNDGLPDSRDPNPDIPGDKPSNEGDKSF